MKTCLLFLQLHFTVIQNNLIDFLYVFGRNGRFLRLLDLSCSAVMWILRNFTELENGFLQQSPDNSHVAIFFLTAAFFINDTVHSATDMSSEFSKRFGCFLIQIKV